MSEADILAMTYWDTCAVYRKQKVKKNNGTTVVEKSTVYEDIKCALGIKSLQSKMNQDEDVASTKYIYTLHTRPNIDILKGDSIVVTNTRKESTEYLVVESHYQISSRVCMLERVERI